MLRLFRACTQAMLQAPGWLAPWAAGLVWRLIAAASGFGWFAIDDYLFVIEKAAVWRADPSAAFDCPYRSTLLPRLMTFLLRMADPVTAADPAYALQVAYAALGVLSTGAIIAVYETARLEADERVAKTCGWLAALYIIMPRICTRALLESCAILPVALSMWALAYATQRQGTPDKHGPGAPAQTPTRYAFVGLAGLLCGVAAMVRFQVGILMVPMALWCLRPAYRCRPGAWPRLVSLLAGGGMAAVLQGLLDRADGRLPLSTPLAYLRYNLSHASQYGVSPAYTYMLQLVMLTVPPACLMLGPIWFEALRRQKLATLCAGVFVFSHSCIAHKEDRFLFPMLPLLFVIMGTALAPMPQQAFALQHPAWSFRIFQAGRRLFWVLNGIGLIVCSFSDAQRNWTMPLLHIARTTPPEMTRQLVIIEPDIVPTYYLHGRASWRGYPTLSAFEQAQKTAVGAVDYVLLRALPDARGQAVLKHMGCQAPRRFDGDAVDRLLVRVNRHNLRRAATFLYPCSPAALTSFDLLQAG